MKVFGRGERCAAGLGQTMNHASPKGKELKRIAPEVEQVGEGRSWSQDATGGGRIHHQAQRRTAKDEPAQSRHSVKSGPTWAIFGTHSGAKWPNLNNVEKDQTQTPKEQNRACLTKVANRPRLHRGAERSRESETMRESGRQRRRGPS